VINYPQDIVAGETFKVCFLDCEFASTSIIIGGPSKQTVPGTLENGHWTASFDSTTWAAGNYQFEAWGTTSTNEKRLVARESFTVSASLASTAAGADVRSVAQQNVDALETYLAGIGNPDSDQSVARYRINNRELFSYPISEIMALLDFWRRRVARERRKARGLAGPGPNINVYV